MDHASRTLLPPSTAREFGFYVDGAWHGGRELFERSSPGHSVPVSLIPKCTTEDLNAAVAAARRAFEDRRWAGISGAARAAVLQRAAEILRRRRDEIAYWEVLENGKPITQARGEIDHCIACFEVGAGAARLLHGDSYNSLGDGLFGMVLREPIGVVGLITPWNFPFLILCERVPFILASGCTMVVKPSEVTSATTLILAEVLAEAGLPHGVYNVITGSGRTIGQALTEHPDVDMLSFTGSTAVGRSCVHASADSNFKKLGLELGGKNPIIVFADSDLDDAADAAAFGISFNTGQCCVSSSRLIVERSVAKAFEAKLAAKMARIRVGDPLDETTQVGAITTGAQNDVILSYIAKGRAEGATVVTGGSVLDLGHGPIHRPDPVYRRDPADGDCHAMKSSARSCVRCPSTRSRKPSPWPMTRSTALPPRSGPKNIDQGADRDAPGAGRAVLGQLHHGGRAGNAVRWLQAVRLGPRGRDLWGRGIHASKVRACRNGQADALDRMMAETGFDYVIVGGGSAGCVLAARLSEDPAARVCLIEAGGRDTNPLIHMPVGFAKMTTGPLTWGLTTVPQRHANNREIAYAQAKVLGGGSSINAEIFTRGHPSDYDRWVTEGAEGWGAKDVQKYFLRSEGNTILSGALHGTDGPLGVSNLPDPNPMSRAFVQSCQELGIPYNPDFNGERQEGAGFYQTTTRNNRRCSAAVGYLRPALKRPNLTLITGALVLRVVFEGTRAVGVEYSVGGAAQIARAASEVIVTSGAIGSPKLMMLSGIGPAAHLAGHGIKVVHDLPGVGQNLTDHFGIDIVAELNGHGSLDKYNKPHWAVWAGIQYALFKSGPVTSNVVEGGGVLVYRQVRVLSRSAVSLSGGRRGRGRGAIGHQGVIRHHAEQLYPAAQVARVGHAAVGRSGGAAAGRPELPGRTRRSAHLDRRGQAEPRDFQPALAAKAYPRDPVSG